MFIDFARDGGVPFPHGPRSPMVRAFAMPECLYKYRHLNHIPNRFICRRYICVACILEVGDSNAENGF
ncbi:unnamed protein product [Victoria cruziana]